MIKKFRICWQGKKGLNVQVPHAFEYLSLETLSAHLIYKRFGGELVRTKNLNKWAHLFRNMTNITLSIDDSVYKKMRKHSEIKWSEFVRKTIKKRIDELELLERNRNNESVLTMLASEEVLKKDWDNKEDERWNDV